jgi:hypothetical protein
MFDNPMFECGFFNLKFFIGTKAAELNIIVANARQ